MLSSYSGVEEVYAEYRERTESIQALYDCSCTNTVATLRTLANNTTAVWLQCRDCGRGIRSLRKADYDLAALPEFDEAKRNSHQAGAAAERQSAYHWLNQKLEEIKEDEASFAEVKNQAWWEKYNIYLRSRQWHVMRLKILERDNNLCQACLTRKATQVHHLTYAIYNQLGYSAAFELVAICYSCHSKIHPRLAEAQHDLALYNPYLNGNGHR